MKRTLPNGAYTTEYQGCKQRPSVGFIRVVNQVVPKGSTIIDIGCGIGMMVTALRQEGWKIDGMDGTPGIEEKSNGIVTEVDLSRPYGRRKPRWDWGLCTEVGEHIPQEFEATLLNNLGLMVRRGLILTWADLGSKGIGHVNCRSQVYIASELAKRHLYVDDRLTQEARACVRPKYRSRLMVAIREG